MLAFPTKYLLNFTFSSLQLKQPYLSANILRNMSTMMKAVCMHEFGSPEVLKVKEVPRPTPSQSEVLVKVHAAGVNPVDTYIRTGEYSNIPRLPTILGKEVSGVIEELGEDVQNLKVGDRVTCCLPWGGGYAEYVTCAENRIISLPDKLTFSQGASLYVAYFSAIRALVTKCQVKDGDNVLIHGASGAVGIAGVQLAQMFGCNVVGTAGTPAGMEIVKSQGVSKVFNHWSTGYALEAYASTNAKGFDAILESSAHLNLGTDLKLLRNGGRICVVGSRGPVEVNPRYLINTEGQIHGIKLFAVTQEEFVLYASIIKEGVESNKINPVVAREYEMSEVSLAHHEIIKKTGAKGKLVLRMS